MKLFYTHTPETSFYEIGFTIFGRNTSLFMYEEHFPTMGIDCGISIGLEGIHIGIGIWKVSFGIQILKGL